ncbi:MAG: MerR family transcriptional regulator [Cryomorphaceae bacterium]|nr:MerR family transcriptional regulator [Flavobacteriales bacterium]
MPYKEKPVEKLYYTIGEVSEMFDVNTSLIRFWEKEFDIIQPKKNKKGNRLFTAADIDNLKIIYHLVKERGYTLQGAREKMKDNKEDLSENVAIVERLREIRAFLMEMKKSL